MSLVNLPAFYNMVYTDKDGRMTADAYYYNDQTFQVLNHIVAIINGLTSTVVTANSVNLNGLNPPSKTTAEITALIADTTVPVRLGTVWYDTDINKLRVVVSVAGVPTLQTIQSI